MSVIPPPSAVTFVGVATLPRTKFLSFTAIVVELIVVVVPFTVKSPDSTRFAAVTEPPAKSMSLFASTTRTLLADAVPAVTPASLLISAAVAVIAVPEI